VRKEMNVMNRLFSYDEMIILSLTYLHFLHTNNNKQQTTNNKQQTTNNKQQTTNNKQQTTNNKQ
jgi:hypothetical protein